MTFPRDLSFISEARKLEVEAVEGGRRTNELSVAPTPPAGLSVLPPEDDVQETDERLALLRQYLPFATAAFRDRGLAYPFVRSFNGASLDHIESQRLLASRVAKLSAAVSIGHGVAKDFERRAVRALHSMIGGWAAGVGAPRDDGTGPAKAVRKFRNLLPAEAHPFDAKRDYPGNGDLGADAFWIMGRSWGGPLVYLQAKNAPFSIDEVPHEFMRSSDVIEEWFGRKLDQVRSVIRVLAVNTVLTQELKEAAFSAAGSGAGVHVFDAVDIISAEEGTVSASARDVLTIM